MSIALPLGNGYEAHLADRSRHVRIIRPDGSICQVLPVRTPLKKLVAIAKKDAHKEEPNPSLS